MKKYPNKLTVSCENNTEYLSTAILQEKIIIKEVHRLLISSKFAYTINYKEIAKKHT